jgi:excisionase family DNA binding protein
MKTENEKDESEIISAREASDILHISYAYFLKLLREGTITIPFSQIGKHVKFKRKDVQDYFEKTFTEPYKKEDKKD